MPTLLFTCFLQIYYLSSILKSFVLPSSTRKVVCSVPHSLRPRKLVNGCDTCSSTCNSACTRLNGQTCPINMSRHPNFNSCILYALLDILLDQVKCYRIHAHENPELRKDQNGVNGVGRGHPIISNLVEFGSWETDGLIYTVQACSCSGVTTYYKEPTN